MLAPFTRQIPRELYHTGLARIVRGANQPAIGNGPAHARNQHNTPRRLELYHRLGRRLRRHEYPGDVDREHAVGVLGRVFQGRGFLLDARRGDESVEPAVLLGDFVDDGRQARYVADVNLAVFEGGVELGLCAGGDDVEVWGRLGEDVEGVDCAVCVVRWSLR